MKNYILFKNVKVYDTNHYSSMIKVSEVEEKLIDYVKCFQSELRIQNPKNLDYYLEQSDELFSCLFDKLSNVKHIFKTFNDYYYESFQLFSIIIDFKYYLVNHDYSDVITQYTFAKLTDIAMGIFFRELFEKFNAKENLRDYYNSYTVKDADKNKRLSNLTQYLIDSVEYVNGYKSNYYVFTQRQRNVIDRIVACMKEYLRYVVNYNVYEKV